MNTPSDYTSGTIVFTNGSVDFTGVGTAWLTAQFQDGDGIIDIPAQPGLNFTIAEITSETAGKLRLPWTGASGATTYALRYHWDSARVTAQSALLREQLGNGNIQSFAAITGYAGGVPVFLSPHALTIKPKTDFVNGVFFNVQVATLADRAAYDGQSGPTDDTPGFTVLVSNVGDGRSAVYSKMSNTVADWSAAAYVTGPALMPDIGAGTTTTLAPGLDATFTVTPVSGGYLLNAGIPRGNPGSPGPTGPTGEGLTIDAAGLLSGRSAYDSQPQGFTYLASDTGPTGGLYVRSTTTAGVWVGPFEFTQGPPGDDGALITTTNGVGNGTAGPYTLNAAPLNADSVWVTWQGVAQYEYTIVVDQITFGANIPTTDKWQVKTSGPLPVPVGAIPPETVTAAMLRASELAAIRTRIGAGTGNGNVISSGTVVDGHLAVFDVDATHVKDGGVVPVVPAIASQAEAEAGTENTKIITSLRTRQAISVISPRFDIAQPVTLTQAQKGQFAANAGQAWEQIGPDIILSVAQAIVSWTGLGAYRKLRLTMNAMPTILGILVAQLGEQSGTVWHTGASAYGNQIGYAAGTSVAGIYSAESYLKLTAANVNVSVFAQIQLAIEDFNVARQANMQALYNYRDGTPILIGGSCSGYDGTIPSVGTRDSLRIFSTAGNLSIGSAFVLEGHR